MRVFLGTLFERKRFCGAPWATIDPDPGSLIFQAEAASLITQACGLHGFVNESNGCLSVDG